MKAPWRIIVLVVGVSALLVVTCLHRGGVTEPVEPGEALAGGTITRMHALAPRADRAPAPHIALVRSAQLERLTESLSPGAKELALAMAAGLPWTDMQRGPNLRLADETRRVRRAQK